MSAATSGTVIAGVDDAGFRMAKARGSRISLRSSGLCSLSPRRSRTLELDPAFLRIGSLLDRNHLAFHLGKFGRRLLVAADKERRGPEDDDRRRGGDTILCPLTILRA